MKDLLKTPLTVEKLEFWAATFVYVCSLSALGYNAVVLLSSGYLPLPYENEFTERGLSYFYGENYFIPNFFLFSSFYCFFLVMNFYVIKAVAAGRNIFRNILLALLISALLVAALGAIATWRQAYIFAGLSEKYAYRRIFKAQFVTATWVTLLLVFYNFAKYFLTYLYKKVYKINGLNQFQQECVAATGVSFLSVVFLVITSMRWSVVIAWSEISLFAIVLYWFSFQYIIPRVVAATGSFYAYITKVVVVLALSFFPVAIIMYMFFWRVESAFMINVFNAGVALFAVAPLSWYIYRSRMQNSKELAGLKTALNQTSANVDFLRSQINPHFLFNALNTLYGTALQENADRTGEGIQRLGDMMRFMLQENVQDQISLMREIDYLNNYIALQKLRTQTSAEIIIQTEIEEQPNGLQIAPMLLIPFVENAFKHGISLRNSSHIKVTLNTRGDQLFFDVYNSIHAKADNDPEQNKSGIGLENVKQRLQLVYPGRYELVIRESAKEFFVHLTLQLT